MVIQQLHCFAGNGPLSAETDYQVAVRAYTSETTYTDGPFTEFISTSADQLIWYIVGAVAGVLVLVIVALLAVFFARRGPCASDTEHHAKSAMYMDSTRHSTRRKTLGITRYKQQSDLIRTYYTTKIL